MCLPGGPASAREFSVAGTISPFAVVGSQTAGMTTGQVNATRIDVTCAGSAACGDAGHAGGIHADELGTGSPMQLTVDRLAAGFVALTGSGRWLISHAANPPLGLRELAATTQPLQLDHFQVDVTILAGARIGC